mmetsp:Transcript_22066/g.52147  ORF Transcript_22066/g.52147 Transcript_22066/m.52147 type:complete len:236 (-) Transcript_22066:506-1213(-)
MSRHRVLVVWCSVACLLEKRGRPLRRPPRMYNCHHGQVFSCVRRRTNERAWRHPFILIRMPRVHCKPTRLHLRLPTNHLLPPPPPLCFLLCAVLETSSTWISCPTKSSRTARRQYLSLRIYAATGNGSLTSSLETLPYARLPARMAEGRRAYLGRLDGLPFALSRSITRPRVQLWRIPKGGGLCSFRAQTLAWTSLRLFIVVLISPPKMEVHHRMSILQVHHAIRTSSRGVHPKS